MFRLQYLTTLLITLVYFSCFAQKPLKTLKKLEVTELDLVASVAEVTPGDDFQIGVMVETKEGKTGSTKGILKGKLKWKEFEVKVKGGKWYGTDASSYIDISHGNITSYEDLSEYETQYVQVEVLLKKDPSINSTLFIPLNYAFENEVLFTGVPGRDGSNGFSGSFNAGGNGRAGNGTPGGDGGPGPHVDVYVKLVENIKGEPLLEATCKKGDYTYTTKVNPNGGTLKVYALGGRGGSGGSGGWGTCSHEKCLSTDGGDGANGGNGGQGGSITFHIDQAAAEYQDKILGFTYGGSPGAAGRGMSGGNSCSCTGLSNTYSEQGAKGIDGSDGYAGQNGTKPKYEIVNKAVF